MIIYKIQNKITNNVYIGQTNNFNRRMREHTSVAFNKNSNDYNKLLSKKFREYGIDNFEFTIIEENLTLEEANEREIYWIDKYNSFKGEGYNESYGGDGVRRESVLDEHYKKIIEDLQYGSISQAEIAKKYKSSESVISDINNGKRFRDNNLDYPIRKNLFTDSQYKDIYNLLKTTKLTFREISEKLGVAESTVKKYNYGKLAFSKELTYPIREINSQEQTAMEIRELLSTTKFPYSKIAELTNSSVSTVRRINRGETRRLEGLDYPIRK